MKLIDIDTGREYSMRDMFSEWQEMRIAEPYNHADDFMTEMFDILMATVNGRNDLDIVGLTPKETDRIITALRTTCERKGTI